MKYLSIILFFLTMPALAISQVSSVSYECELSLKPINPENGLNKLYFEGTESLYVFEEWPTSTRTKLSGTTLSYVAADEEGMPIYTNLSTQQQIYKDPFYAPKTRPWIFTEKIPEISWVITNKERDFGGLTAFFATGSYGGRDYEVWFTPAIPIPLGPHRLNGLPGLILEAVSTDGLVKFMFAGYLPVEPEPREIAPPQIGNAISRRMFEKYLIQRLLKTEANSPPEWNDTMDDPPVDFEIERSKWTVFGDYKRARLRENGGG